ncbi:uncharacterized protein LOC125260777 [Megalobrama amblycephala]|uniref:uncharacterized protein LOC125260777 n=1 Tax=Megalobrama amblycephala TaxID=75352 RepID=UPI002014570F|nr:uncharacterized protein LOC125260777 [Megalobrama amblycephala]
MSFLLPYMQPRSSRHTLQSEPEPLDMTVAEEDVEPELSELTTPFNPLPAIQRPATPLLAGERSATPTPLPSTRTPQITAHRADTPTPTIHPRVQALVTDSQQQKRRRTVSPTTTEQQLLDIITQPTTPAPPNVPRQEDEMYYFALSLVLKLNRLLPRNRTRAQIQIMTYLADLELEDDGQRQQQPTQCITPEVASTHNHLDFSPFTPHPPTMRNKLITPNISHLPQSPPCLNSIPPFTINCSNTV